MFSFVQDPLVAHAPSSVNIDLCTLPPLHEEPKLPHLFEQSASLHKTYSTAHVPKSSAILISGTQTGENALHYPLVIILLILTVFLMIFLLSFVKVNALAHLTISCLVSYSHLSPFHAFLFSLDPYFVTMPVLEVLSIPG